MLWCRKALWDWSHSSGRSERSKRLWDNWVSFWVAMTGPYVLLTVLGTAPLKYVFTAFNSLCQIKIVIFGKYLYGYIAFVLVATGIWCQNYLNYWFLILYSVNEKEYCRQMNKPNTCVIYMFTLGCFICITKCSKTVPQCHDIQGIFAVRPQFLVFTK